MGILSVPAAKSETPQHHAANLRRGRMLVKVRSRSVRDIYRKIFEERGYSANSGNPSSLMKRSTGSVHCVVSDIKP